MIRNPSFKEANQSKEGRATGSEKRSGHQAASKAVSYAMHYSRSHDAVICVYDRAGELIETHEERKTPNERARVRLQAESWQITAVQKKVTQAIGNR